MVEVVVRCEFQNPESNLNEKAMVYFHLKHFFRGRFANRPALNNIASKYKEGDHLHVSGKVGIFYASNKIDRLGAVASLE